MPVAPTNGYCTGDELKAALSGLTGTAEDAALERAIETASRTIDDYCGQVFYAVTSSTRYYTAKDHHSLWLHGSPASTRLRAATSVEVDTTGNGTFNQTWTEGTHFFLAPRTAAADSEPYKSLEVIRNSGRSWPVGIPEAVKIVGTFGWAATPDAVVDACIRLATLVYQAVAEGSAPTFGFGDNVPRVSRFIDGQVQQWLAPYRLNPILVG